MVTAIKELKNNILENKDELNECCKQLIDVMCLTLNTIIEKSIKEWYNANHKSIEIIEEALQRLKNQNKGDSPLYSKLQNNKKEVQSNQDKSHLVFCFSRYKEKSEIA